MITTGPYSLGLNVPLVVSDPYASSGSASANVQIQNQSGFILTVKAAGASVAIQSFQAQTIPTSGGAPITVTPTSSISAGGTNSLLLVWLLPGEISDLADGPFPVAEMIGTFNANITNATLNANISGGNVSVNNSFGTTIQTSSSSEPLYSGTWSAGPAAPGTTYVVANFSTPSVPVHAAALLLSINSQASGWAGSSSAWIHIKAYSFQSASNFNATAPIYDSGRQYDLVQGNTLAIWLPVGIIPVDPTTNSLLIAITVFDPGGPVITGGIDIIGYTQAIPPDPALTRNTISSNAGISIGNALAPSNQGGQSIVTGAAGGTILIGTALGLPANPYIMKSFTVSNLSGAQVEAGPSGFGISTLKQLSALSGSFPTVEFIYGNGIYQPGEATSALSFYSGAAYTFRICATWTPI